MKNLKPLIKECKIGEKEFNLAIHRDLAVEILAKFPKYWEIATKHENLIKIKEDGTYDIKHQELNIKKLGELMEAENEISEMLPKIMDYAIPKMLKLAQCEMGYQEILDYCVDNYAEDEFFAKSMEFIMLGFTKGKTAKVPKVKIQM